MPQLAPYTLELQFNSTVTIIAITVVAIACYVLPSIAKLLLARIHLTV